MDDDIHSGSCHCGAVRFEVEADLRKARILDCNCSICTKKGFLHLIVEAQDFRLLAGEDALETYQFNTKVARHHFCRTCGIHPFYVPRSHPHAIDVNIRALDNVDLDALTIEAFDGRNWEEKVDSIRREDR